MASFVSVTPESRAVKNTCKLSATFKKFVSPKKKKGKNVQQTLETVSPSKKNIQLKTDPAQMKSFPTLWRQLISQRAVCCLLLPPAASVSCFFFFFLSLTSELFSPSLPAPPRSRRRPQSRTFCCLFLFTSTSRSFVSWLLRL